MYVILCRIMLKQKVKNILIHSAVMLMAVLLASPSVLVPAWLPKVRADRFQDQIDVLNQENNQKKEVLDGLKVEATGLQATITALQGQIAGLQSQINTNQARNDDLQKQISVAEEELARQKRVLGQNIRAMYLEGQISTIEMLASSKDLSEFVDKQQYRNSVQDKIKTTLDKVTALKLQLKGQKEEVEKLIKEQQKLQGQLAAQQGEQNRLLGLNQSQQSMTDQEIKDNYNKIADLKRQQAIENMRLFGGGTGVLGGGGYPWGNAACIHTGQVEGWCPNYDWAVNGSIWNWATGGYGYRNCTDWVSYRVRSTGRYAPSGLGHAKNWVSSGAAYGYRVDRTPEVGAAAVSTAGTYGHVMYVEAVNSNGTITVSDYNRAGTGKYDSNSISAGALWFVHF